MKHILFFVSLFFIFSACNKTEFIEKKIPQSINSEPEQVQATTVASPSNIESHAEISPEMKNQNLPKGHPPVDLQSTAINVGKINKAANGITVAECFLKNANLSNSQVTIRGKVVKFNSGIMGKNWLHIRDGSGIEGKNDLVVTTSQSALLNDTVVITGKLQYDLDIGSGYVFPAIVQDARVKIE